MPEPRRARLSTLLFVLSGVSAVAMLGFWFAAVWTHGPDTPSRLAASGFLAAFLAGALCVAGFGAMVGEK